MVPHDLAQLLSRAILSRLAPVQPEHLLDEQAMQEMAPRVRCHARYAVLVGFLSVGIPTVALTLALYRLQLLLQRPAMNAVLDTRWAFPWAGTGLMLGFCIGYVPSAWFTRWWFGRDLDRYLNYEMTSKGYDPRRVARFVLPVALVLGAVMALAVWNTAQVVDHSGIRFSRGLFASQQREYAEVRGIGLYRQLRAPVGVRERENLDITFVSGPPLQVLSNKGSLKPEKLEQIAAYISAKSGVSVTRGQLRP